MTADLKYEQAHYRVIVCLQNKELFGYILHMFKFIRCEYIMKSLNFCNFNDLLIFVPHL